MSRKIPTGATPDRSVRIEPGETPSHRDRAWSFSFRFFKQMENFGVRDCQPTWFVSLIDRLKDLSTRTVKEITESPEWMRQYRYHRIDWAATNIPVRRRDLSWIYKDYLENEEDFPLYQFQISMANGRVVGFFDENWVFNIVLVDPNHNMQPSKDYDYRVTPCFPLDNHYECLKKAIHEHFTTGGKGTLDPNKVDAGDSWFSVVYIDDDVVAEAEGIAEHGFPPSEIFRLGIAAVRDLGAAPDDEA